MSIVNLTGGPSDPLLFTDIGLEVPQLRRGTVWCVHCGAVQTVDGAACLQHGWPECCGETMTIDSPQERRRANMKRLEQLPQEED